KTARFRAEALLAARLQHPNIVQVFEVGQLPDGRPFFVMEYIEGGSLASHIAGTPQPAEDAARLVVTVARAVQHAHLIGIVHRDLKPANILLQRTEERGQRKEDRGKQSEAGNQDPGTGSSDLCSLSSVLCPLASVLWPKVADFGLAKDLGDSGGASRTGD